MSLAREIAQARLYVRAEGRAIREAAGLPLAAVAGRLGVSVPTLCRWERGTHRPPAAAVLRWRRLLDELEAQVRAAA